jgi:hypothetical protein
MPGRIAYPIGSLRWLVWLARRRQIAPDTNSGIVEDYETLARVHCSIEALQPLTYWAGQTQVDTPVTHLIRLRWLDAIDNTHAVLRTTLRDDNSERREVFRVRRMRELGGIKRFVEIEAELEIEQ